MPETLTDRNRCHKCDKTGKRKKDKLSKCGRCQAITYCGRECQVEDWPRHKENCVPVMVTETEGKGLGLVAAKDIKMGELILIDKAMVSEKDKIHYIFDLTAKAERLLLSEKILKDISLLNHSCAPNAAMGLLDGETNEELENRFELRAVKDISKGDEITIHYPSLDQDSLLQFPHAIVRAMIQKNFGFDCRCLVCLGKVPNQDDIIEKICETHEDYYDVVLRLDDDGKAPEDWKREAIFFEMMNDLAKPLYMGRKTEKMKYIFLLFSAARFSDDSILMKKALDEMKELADKTGLEMMKYEFEIMREAETD